MKNFIPRLSLVVFLAALTTTSCNKETHEPLFIGKWEMQFLHKIAYVDNVYLGDTTLYWAPGDAWIEFRANNTGHTTVLGAEGYEFTWSLTGDSIRYIVAGQSDLFMQYAAGETNFTFSNKMNEGPYAKDPEKTYKEIWYIWAKRL
jgi:hypothetical protein